MADSRVVRTAQSASVAVSLVASLMFGGVAAAAIALLIAEGFQWIWLACAIMFLGQAIAAASSANRRSTGRGQPDPRARLMLPWQYRVVGGAALLAAALFHVAGFAGEGWSLALVAAVGCIVWGSVRIGIAWHVEAGDDGEQPGR